MTNYTSTTELQRAAAWLAHHLAGHSDDAKTVEAGQPINPLAIVTVLAAAAGPAALFAGGLVDRLQAYRAAVEHDARPPEPQ